ncbi:MAG: nitrous oxide reductase accessory protein NosL [Longimicrobiales bacterium]|nr:nitrous oxide reductase accessory protein NosL [Longimicrobiales bacterium]
MMTKGSRAVILLASLALGLVYVLPLWRINLEAPQYPEGLGMVIRVDNIEGVKKHDLNNINNLNHYIGMKRIEPDSIPELRLMPVILAVLIGLGVLTAALGRRKVLYGWVAVFLAVSLVGLADFWKWEYDYGHDLDEETAIIKIPGMSYQPPLIGSRQILNFKAHSWPGAGGWIAIAAAMSGMAVAFGELRRGRREAAPLAGDGPSAGAPPTGTPPALLLLAATAGLAAVTACGEPQPRDLAYGEERCEYCHMGLADDRHGAELLTETGKAFGFDSVECLAAHLASLGEPSRVHSVWVTDFSNPGALILAEEAFFLASPTLRSPMGLGLSAFARREDRDGAVVSFGGQALDWAGVQALVAREWSETEGAAPHAGMEHGDGD